VLGERYIVAPALPLPARASQASHRPTGPPPTTTTSNSLLVHAYLTTYPYVPEALAILRLRRSGRGASSPSAPTIRKASWPSWSL